MNNLREIIFEKIASLFPRSYTEPCEKGIKLLVLLVLVGCGKDKTETSQPRENFNANASARPELNVFETPGFWEQVNEVITPDGKTNRTTAVSHATWGLKGHHLLIESEVRAGENMKHNLVVKHFNELAPPTNTRAYGFRMMGSCRALREIGGPIRAGWTGA